MFLYLLFSRYTYYEKTNENYSTKKNNMAVPVNLGRASDQTGLRWPLASRNGGSSSNSINPNHFARRVFVSRPEKTAAFRSWERDGEHLAQARALAGFHSGERGRRASAPASIKREHGRYGNSLQFSSSRLRRWYGKKT